MEIFSKSSVQRIIWKQCDLVIQKIRPNQYFQGVFDEIYESLQSQIKFQPNSVHGSFQPIIKILRNISLPRKKPTEDNANKVIPLILIKFPIVFLKQLLSEQQKTQLWCQITGVIMSKKQSYPFLKQVHLEGETSKIFSETGIVRFRNIFYSPSQALLEQQYNEKRITHFVISIFVKSQEEQKYRIVTYISSPMKKRKRNRTLLNERLNNLKIL